YKHYVFENPLTPVEYDSNGVVISMNSYVHPDSADLAPADWSFQDSGMKMQHLKRQTSYYVAKLDLTSQLSNSHQTQAGIELRLYDLNLEEFNIRSLDETQEFQPMIPERSSINNNMFQNKPVEFSAYVQDKMEYQDMVVNLGIRFDYFDPDGRVYADPLDPNIYSPYSADHRYKNAGADSDELIEYTLAEKEAFWWKKASKKYSISPRFGIAYPITDRGIIHFSYGHFFQIPSFRELYGGEGLNADIQVGQTQGNTAFLPNADLDPQKTVMYEIGLQQQLSTDIHMDATLFYRDIRDWVGSSVVQPTYIKSIFYTKFINKDYSNVRGITLSMNKRYSSFFEGSLDYTYMIAEGTASNPQDEYNDRLSDRAPRIQIIPLGWDQRHTLNGHISFGAPTWRLSLLGRFWTGSPYTPSFAVGEVSGSSAFSGLRENSARKPNIFTFDLRLFKQFNFAGLQYSIFINVYNLLDSRGQTNVYTDTGSADYTLSIRNASDNPKRVGLLSDNAIQTAWYIEPRQIHAGISVGF
ncbi:hypothetical protein BVY01_00010, partial [bacterium I07]